MSDKKRFSLSKLLFSELVALGFRKGDARLAYKALVEAIARELLAHNEINIRGLGTLYITDRKPQTVNTPFTDGPVEVKPMKLLRFRPSTAFKDLLNAQEEK